MLEQDGRPVSGRPAAPSSSEPPAGKVASLLCPSRVSFRAQSECLLAPANSQSQTRHICCTCMHRAGWLEGALFFLGRRRGTPLITCSHDLSSLSDIVYTPLRPCLSIALPPSRAYASSTYVQYDVWRQQSSGEFFFKKKASG